MDDERPPRVFETPGGFSVSYKGRFLYSARDPARLPRRLAAACDPEPGRLHLVPSPLLWHGVRELLEAAGPGSALLCVETDRLLAELARSALPADLAADGRVTLLEASSPDAAVDDARRAALAMGPFRACALTPLSGGMGLDAGTYEAMASAIGSELEAAWRNRAALMVLGPRWARNLFDNLSALPAIAPEPFPRFPGPAFVCGAGPSLEAALPLIGRACASARAGARASGRASVVACDTALGTLLAAGIEPDLVVCLEGQAHNLADFTCLGSRGVRLAADLSSHPATFRAVRGAKHLTLARITRSPFLERAQGALEASGLPFLAVPPLGSVGVHAVHLAGLLARGPLIAVGLDFSFEPGKTHARGCPSLLAEAGRLSRLTRWPGQFAASYRDRTIKLGPSAEGSRPSLSDPILLSYAALLASGGEKLYDLRTHGPSIGGRRISQAEAEALLVASGAGAAEGAGASERPGSADACRATDAGRAAGAAKAFLLEEGRRLEALRSSMRGARTLAKDEFRRLALESDYLWWGFPDQDRAGDLPQDFLNRLVPQVEFWSERIAKLAARAGD